jgi:hypothetical protein
VVPAACWDAYQTFSNMSLGVLESQLDEIRSQINLRLVPLRALSDDLVSAGLKQLLAASPEVYAVVGANFGQDGRAPEEVRGARCCLC